MKQDIDKLMMEHGIETLLVTGGGQHNPYMVYMMGGGHLTRADLIKKRGDQAVIFCDSMERDEATRSGLKTHSYSKYPWKDLLAKAGNDPFTTRVLLYGCILEELGIISGKVLLYGQTDLGMGYGLFTRLQKLYPNIEFVGPMDKDILRMGMATKDEKEILRIQEMGKITIGVVSKTAEYLCNQRIKNNLVVDKDDNPITVGMVKSKINLWLAEQGAENPEDTIFSIGKDAGVPHSSGNPNDFLRAGQTIVFDIFPCEFGGGYYYDFTRTWCLGYGSDEVLKLHEQVLDVYNRVVKELKLNEPFSKYQGLTNSLFEEKGHPTTRTDPSTENGYVHSIGHGLGLHVHEVPFSGKGATPDDILAAGSVFTIEPGLYYPDKGMGVRLEDTFWMDQNGIANKFVEYPMDFILPIRTVD